MSLTISGSTTSLASSAGAASGSDAQRAYTAAVKDLKDAQQQLRKDTLAKASDETLKVDQAAVQLAQMALAAAAAEMAKENREARDSEASTRTPDRGATVDLYT